MKCIYAIYVQLGTREVLVAAVSWEVFPGVPMLQWLVDLIIELIRISHVVVDLRLHSTCVGFVGTEVTGMQSSISTPSFF